MTDKQREYNRTYYLKHRDDLLARSKKYNAENKEKKLAAQRKRRALGLEKDYYDKEKRREYSRAWYKKNKAYVNKKSIQRARERRKTDVLFRITNTFRARASCIFKSFGGKKPISTKKLLGAEIEVVKKYIEDKFQENMSWANYGEWHIDHIIPLASAKTKDDLVKLFHYKNLQPLWAKDNLSKYCNIKTNKSFKSGFNEVPQ